MKKVGYVFLSYEAQKTAPLSGGLLGGGGGRAPLAPPPPGHASAVLYIAYFDAERVSAKTDLKLVVPVDRSGLQDINSIVK